MRVGDGLDRVVEALAVLSAVAEDLVVLQPADHVLHSCTHDRLEALSGTDSNAFSTGPAPSTA